MLDNPADECIDEDDIMSIKITNKDYHNINKTTYEIKLHLDSKGYYSSRLGVDMYPLKTSQYTFVLPCITLLLLTLLKLKICC